MERERGGQLKAAMKGSGRNAQKHDIGQCTEPLSLMLKLRLKKYRNHKLLMHLHKSNLVVQEKVWKGG